MQDIELCVQGMNGDTWASIIAGPTWTGERVKTVLAARIPAGHYLHLSFEGHDLQDGQMVVDLRHAPNTPIKLQAVIAPQGVSPGIYTGTLEWDEGWWDEEENPFETGPGRHIFHATGGPIFHYEYKLIITDFRNLMLSRSKNEHIDEFYGHIEDWDDSFTMYSVSHGFKFEKRIDHGEAATNRLSLRDGSVDPYRRREGKISLEHTKVTAEIMRAVDARSMEERMHFEEATGKRRTELVEKDGPFKKGARVIYKGVETKNSGKVLAPGAKGELAEDQAEAGSSVRIRFLHGLGSRVCKPEEFEVFE